MEESTLKYNHEVKLKELLRNFTSAESNLFAESSKQFIRILGSDSGAEFIRVYVESSSKLVELWQAWESWKTKSEFFRVLNLVSEILKHHRGKVSGDVGRVLDKFGRIVIEEKMLDLYKELNSKEGKRQNAVLLLLASIIQRSSYMALEVAKIFDFKLPVFSKLAEVRLRGKQFDKGKRKSSSTRKSFVCFAMAFLEVGYPRLLRGILQQKEMYSGVLRGLGNDDEENVIHVLSILRDRVLVPESLVPTGLRSVLFGSVTLEQLISISGRNDFGDATRLAHDVLVLVCTDPLNGLMPDLKRHPHPLYGNRKRLLDLMKKLKATEVEYHLGLLLAIVKVMPSFGSAYLDEFPYNIEDLSSAEWLAAVSTAADVVSSVNDGLTLGFADNQEPLAFESPYVQNVLKCIVPRPFTRLVINKGLLHCEPLVKHGTLRLLLMGLKLLDSFLNYVGCSVHLYNQMTQKWDTLKADIENEVRTLLPDPQVLLSLLSPISNHFNSLMHPTKRKCETEIVPVQSFHVSKRLKSSAANEDIDILVGGISEVDMSSVDQGNTHSTSEQGLEKESNSVKSIDNLWGLRKCSTADVNDSETYFYSKLLDTLKIYHRTMPMALEGLFDLFRFLPNNPLRLPTILQLSLLQFLSEHACEISRDRCPVRTQTQMYKHLHSFIVLLMYSSVREIKEHAYNLAKAAMSSTGAFNNAVEICAWFSFIPGYGCTYVNDVEVEILQKLSSAVISFLCDAASTIGNNLFKYMEFLRRYTYEAEGGRDLSHDVSPFIICVLDKCIRLVSSESAAFSLPQKSLISQYVCNTIKYILDTQVNSGPLSSLIDRLLSEKLESLCSTINVLELDECPCELRPLKTLLCFARNMLHQQSYRVCSNVMEVNQSNYSFMNTLSEIKCVLRNEYDIGIIGLAVGFSSSLICARHTEILQNFPLILCISRNLREVPFSVLASVFFLEPNYLTDVFNLWPDMFISGVQSVIHGREQEEKFGTDELDSTEAASMAFGFYLKRVPFCVLFSAVLQSGSLHLFEKSALQKFLLAKLIEMPPDHLVSSLCNILFWINNMRSPHKVGTFDELELLSEICFILAEHLLRQILAQSLDNVALTHISGHQPLHYTVEVAEIILNHPAVTELLTFPVSGDKEFSGSIFKGNLELLLKLSEQEIQRMDHNVLNLLKTFNELLFKIFSGQRSEQALNVSQKILRAFKGLIQKLFLAFKNEFERCIGLMDFNALVPVFYTLHTLICFISPLELFELVDWLFSKVDFRDTSWPIFAKEDALCIGLHLASCAFDFLLSKMLNPCLQNKDNSFWGATVENHLNLSLVEQIFFQVFEIACIFNLDAADECLLKAVKVVKMHKGCQQPCISSIMDLLVVIASSPVDMISHCLNRMNRTKAELLFLVSELSPLHLSIFGHLFSETMKKSLLPMADRRQKNYSSPFSDEELLMILPTVFLYVNSIKSKFGGELHEPFERIIITYKQIVLDGFSDWKNFVSGNIFEMRLGESTPSSFQEFLTIFSYSLLGKTIRVFIDHLAASEGVMNIETRLNLFDSVCPHASVARDDLFNCYRDDSALPSPAQSLDYVNRVVAKVNFCRVLLLPDYNQFQNPDNEQEKVPLEVDPAVGKLRIRFIRILINSWTLMVKKSPANTDYHENIESQNISCYTFLEVFIMRNILNLTAEWHNHLIRSSSLPFIEQLVKSFLLYRFEDPTTVKMVRNVLTFLTRGKFSSDALIQLLLAHSQFAKLINPSNKSPSDTQLGLVFTPMMSILKSCTFSSSGLDALDFKNDMLTSQRHLHLLELVKLVRVLFNINVLQNRLNRGEGTGVQSKELIHLLFSSYGATCNDVDIEIYSLILEIESNDVSCAGTIAQMDYLWGIASLRVRKDWEKDEDIGQVNSETVEVLEEIRKIRFRENLPVDPKMCAQTVLYFPYDRCVNGRTVLEFQKDDSSVANKGPSTTDHKLQIYDPIFILRFSIHCLSMGYIEPTEFASLGLLAITFVSTSSPDDDTRKLGYEALAKFKDAIEKCKKKQHVAQLRLLVLYVQNGIEEEWQRIPSIIAVFIAEASLVLLDPSHDNYSTISKFVMNSPCVNMRIVPLFDNLFWSSSVSFRNDRLWILRLLYAGLNVDDDAQIYIQNSIFEKILGFYSSHLSDNDSQELIIQIVKKAVKLHKLAWNLVEHCGIILWLSSIASSHCWGKLEDIKKFISTRLPIIMEVLNAIILPRKIIEWLQKHALEQLSELSCHLYKLLVSGVITEQSSVGNSILQLLSFVLKISQKRKIYQPHFTLSDTGLFQLCEAVDICSKRSCSLSMVLGLEAVLMSAPPVNILRMDHKNLFKLLRWSITIAVQSNSTGMLLPENSDCHLINVSMRIQDEVSHVSKLLRWLTASVILGHISSKSSKFNSAILLERSSFQTLQSLLEFNYGFGEDVECASKDVLATSIIYLLQLVGFSHSLLPSAVAALCILLLPGSLVSEFLDGHGISLPSLCMKIRCPVEANPSWRWSFYQPWRDHSLALNATEKLDEIHASEKLLKIASLIIGRRKSSSSKFVTKDLDKFHVYEWERSIFISKK